MLAQAQAERPNECCGLLAGTIGTDGTARALRRFPLVNELGSPVEFYNLGKDLFTAHRDAREAGLEMLALYHSHPTSAPVPSRKDCERNYGPDVMNLIISLNAPEPTMKAWWLAASGFREGEWSFDV
jgi:proteasome lid subunit RPN8/RPN11